MTNSSNNPLIKQTPIEHQQRLLNIASIASLVVAITLVGIKSFAWFKTDSVALLGSLLDSSLDMAAALINLYFIRSALRPADHDHRFGHGKAEPLGGMLQAMIIGGSALFLCAESVRRFTNPELPDNSTLGINIMIISSALTAGLVAFQHYVVKRTGSMIISGDALHGLGDLLINAGVILALLLSNQLEAPFVDPIIALLLAMILLKGAWSIGKNAIEQLMDTEFSEEERKHIKCLACEHPKVTGVHDLRTRRAGMSSFIQLHIEMDGNMPLREAHDVADQVEHAIRQEYPNTEVLIHQDPEGVERIDSFLRS